MCDTSHTFKILLPVFNLLNKWRIFYVRLYVFLLFYYVSSPIYLSIVDWFWNCILLFEKVVPLSIWESDEVIPWKSNEILKIWSWLKFKKICLLTLGYRYFWYFYDRANYKVKQVIPKRKNPIVNLIKTDWGHFKEWLFLELWRTRYDTLALTTYYGQTDSVCNR